MPFEILKNKIYYTIGFRDNNIGLSAVWLFFEEEKERDGFLDSMKLKDPVSIPVKKVVMQLDCVINNKIHARAMYVIEDPYKTDLAIEISRLTTAFTLNQSNFHPFKIDVDYFDVADEIVFDEITKSTYVF